MKQNDSYSFDEESRDTIIFTYKGKRKKLDIVETIAVKSIKLLGRRASGMLYLLLSLIFIIVGYKSISYYPPSDPSDIHILDFFLLLSGCFFFLAWEVSIPGSYFRSLKCRYCGREFAYIEVEEPEIKEISTLREYTVKVYRYYRCAYCGYNDVVESTDEFSTTKMDMKNVHAVDKLYPYLTRIFGESLLSSLPFLVCFLHFLLFIFYRGSFLSLIVLNIILLSLIVLSDLAAHTSRTLRCRGCGKNFAYKEFRKSDRKENRESGEVIKTVYYRCKYCNHEYIRTISSYSGDIILISLSV